MTATKLELATRRRKEKENWADERGRERREAGSVTK